MGAGREVTRVLWAGWGLWHTESQLGESKIWYERSSRAARDVGSSAWVDAWRDQRCERADEGREEYGPEELLLGIAYG